MPAWAQAPSDLLADVKGLKCRKEEGAVRVSYRVRNALGPELRGSLEDGITVRFVHEITVQRRRALFNKSLARKTIEVSATLDTLTRQYALRRKIDDEMVAGASTDRAAEVEAWLSEVHDLAIPLSEPARGSLILKVKTIYKTNYFVLWVLPWPLGAVGDTECR